MFDDLQKLRIRRDGFSIPGPSLGSGGSPAFVGIVTTASPVVGQFFDVSPTILTGAEVAGGAGTITIPDGSVEIPVYAVGPSAPVMGDYLICRFVNYRWVAERMNSTGGGSGGVGTIPFCFCEDPPGVLNMVSSDHVSDDGFFQDATITYQTVPAAFAGSGLTGSIYTSYPEGFPDPGAGGAVFYYLLFCQYNEWSLQQYYPTSPYGSPFRGPTIYLWYVGAPGNTCGEDALNLNNGLIQVGPAAITVTINGP